MSWLMFIREEGGDVFVMVIFRNFFGLVVRWGFGCL